MRISIGEIDVFSREYRSFNDLNDEFVEHEDQHGRRVPDFDFGVMLGAIAIFLLERAADKFVSDALEWRRRREQGKLDEKRHEELIDKLDELIETTQQAIEARPPQAALSEDAARVSALLQWAKREDIRIDIVLETEAESDLRAALEGLTIDAPGDVIEDAKFHREDAE